MAVPARTSLDPAPPLRMFAECGNECQSGPGCPSASVTNLVSSLALGPLQSPYPVLRVPSRWSSDLGLSSAAALTALCSHGLFPCRALSSLGFSSSSLWGKPGGPRALADAWPGMTESRSARKRGGLAQTCPSRSERTQLRMGSASAVTTTALEPGLRPPLLCVCGQLGIADRAAFWRPRSRCGHSGCRETVGAPGLCSRAREGRCSPAASGRKPCDLPCPLNRGQSESLLGGASEPAGSSATLPPLGWGDCGGRCQDESPSARLPRGHHAHCTGCQSEQETHARCVNADPGCYCSSAQPVLTSAPRGRHSPKSR